MQNEAGTPAGMEAARATTPGLIDDLVFLQAWEQGMVPWPSAALRVRQIRRANPALAAQVCGAPALGAAVRRAEPERAARRLANSG